MRSYKAIMIMPALAAFLFAVSAEKLEPSDGSGIQCAMLVYADNKTSVCFSDRFLKRLSRETNIKTASAFVKVPLGSRQIYRHPFCIMSGEGEFQLSPNERTALQRYLEKGGFLLASAGCSNGLWSASFKKEMGLVFPRNKMIVLPMNHAVFKALYKINSVQTVHERTPKNLSALVINGRIAVVFSPDGLNDAAHQTNCCCCEGDELALAEYINANILAYALVH